MFNAGWEWKMQGQVLNRFYSSQVRSKMTAFLIKYNDHFLLNVDDVFKVPPIWIPCFKFQFQFIILPYDDYNLQFFVLLPVRRFGLKSALKVGQRAWRAIVIVSAVQKLTKDRFETLIRDAEREFVNVAMPKFDNLELLRNAKNMGLQLPIKVNLEYKVCLIWPEKWFLSEFQQKPRVAGLLYRPENREPYYFHADHPFVFGILRSSKPVFLGVYK